MEVTAGLAESNGSLLPGLCRDSLHDTYGLTACTPGSAPGPTLGNEYGKTLPFLHECIQEDRERTCHDVEVEVAVRSVDGAAAAVLVDDNARSIFPRRVRRSSSSHFERRRR